MSRPPLPERSLAAVNPELAAQLHPTRNGATTAEAVSAGSPVCLWWACPRGHDWQAPVKDRIRGAGCPYCAGRLAAPETCLAARDPALAAQWHPTRNGTLTPADVLPSSNRRVWWQCPSGHAWATQVTARTRGTGCPDCSRPQPAPTLLTGHPDLAAQWDTTANGELTPAVTAGSKPRVRWRCPNGHQWLARIDSRISGAGCPYYAGRVTTPETAFGVRYPHLRDEWAGDLNGNLDPATVGPGGSRRVWWRCRTDPDHMWQAAVRSPTGAPGAPAAPTAPAAGSPPTPRSPPATPRWPPTGTPTATVPAPRPPCTRSATPPPSGGAPPGTPGRRRSPAAPPAAAAAPTAPADAPPRPPPSPPSGISPATVTSLPPRSAGSSIPPVQPAGVDIPPTTGSIPGTLRLRRSPTAGRRSGTAPAQIPRSTLPTLLTSPTPPALGRCWLTWWGVDPIR